MQLTLNQGTIGKMISELDELPQVDDKAEVSREIQIITPSLIFKRLKKKLLESGIINTEVITKMGLKPMVYK